MMKTNSLYSMAALFGILVFMFSKNNIMAQSVDELKITVKQLEAKNSALEAKVKKLQKVKSKSDSEAEEAIQQLQEENDELRAEIRGIRETEQALFEAEAKAKSNKIKIADPAFNEYLLRYCDMDNDGILTQWDAEHTYVIDIERDKSLLKKLDNSKSINSLDGIEHFVNLRRLVCSGNIIPQIDLSNNVYIETFIANGCELKLLNVSNNDNLVRLECSNNLLYTIDLSSNSNLQQLDLYKNKLAVLNLSGCAKLKVLMCADNTLTSLDVSNNVELESINCSSNKLVQLSFVNNTKLIDIDISNNNLISVDLQNGADINYIDCTKNKNLEYVVLSKGKRVLADRKDSKTRYK